MAFVRLASEGILGGRSARDAFMLGLRLIAARGMSVVTLIVAAWLVDIQAFADFGVYQTLATLAGIALFLRYDAAVVAARDQHESRTALHLCISIGIVLWLACAVASLSAGAAGWVRGDLALLLPFSILARGLLRLTYARITGESDFVGLGRTILIQAILQPIALLILVLYQLEDVLCFVFADLIGHGSAVAYLLWRHRKQLRGLLKNWSSKAIFEAAERWKSLPLYNLPGSFFSIAFIMSPLLITPMAAGPIFAGHTALAYRIFDVPTQVIAAASTPIFLNLRPSIERRTPIFGRSTLLGLVLLVGVAYAAMAGILILADPYMTETALAGLTDVIPVIAVFHLFVALANPLNDSCALIRSSVAWSSSRARRWRGARSRLSWP